MFQIVHETELLNFMLSFTGLKGSERTRGPWTMMPGLDTQQLLGIWKQPQRYMNWLPYIVEHP